MIAAQVEGVRGWLRELAQVALAAAGVWVAFSALDIVMYERMADDGGAASPAPLACVISAPLTERVQAGRLEIRAKKPLSVDGADGTGELAAALARVKATVGGVAGGIREDGVFFVDVASVADLAGADLHQASAGAPARLVCPSGIVEILPFSRTARRNFEPIKLPHPTRIIDEKLYLPVRGLDEILPVTATWDREARSWTLACGGREMKVAVSEDLFEITIDRSDRTLEVCYAGQRLVMWRCCTGEGNNSPIGEWRVQNKAQWAPWISYEGEYIPGGSPRNPLGARWLGTTARGWETGRAIGIHGTNQPSSIGRRISGGCIRLTNAHSIEMYNTIPVGARVIIRE